MIEPPPIESVPPGTARPLWSVMIPTYNCAGYLGRTLESVLAQDLGAQAMHIEVVDDCSNVDDPEAIVDELGKGRVRFYRKAKNEGAILNFNTCIERSVGHLVHILHGDDLVGREFYCRMGAAFENSPECASIFCRALTINEEDDLIELSPYAHSLRHRSNDPAGLMLTNPIRTPGVVVRRSFYEQNGGFFPDLVHTADWEMWVRVIVRGGARMLNSALASYRFYASNDSSRLMRTAENLRDLRRLAALWERQGLHGFDRKAFDRMVARIAVAQWQRFRDTGQTKEASANYSFLKEHVSMGSRLSLRVKGRVRSALQPFVGLPCA